MSNSNVEALTLPAITHVYRSKIRKKKHMRIQETSALLAFLSLKETYLNLLPFVTPIIMKENTITLHEVLTAILRFLATKSYKITNILS